MKLLLCLVIYQLVCLTFDSVRDPGEASQCNTSLQFSFVHQNVFPCGSLQVHLCHAHVIMDLILGCFFFGEDNQLMSF